MTIQIVKMWSLLLAAALMSSKPPMGGHLVIPQNDIFYTNEPPMGTHLR